jgi:hypothetical protein
MLMEGKHQYRYDEYELDPNSTPLNKADHVLESVIPMYTGDRISGFTKIVSCAEIARLHEQRVIGYDPDQQRGWRLKWKEGVEVGRQYQIKREKMKEIAQTIAEDRHHNRTRHVNARYNHVALYFEPTGKLSDDRAVGRLYLFRKPDSPFNQIESLLTIPDSAHRQEGDKYFATVLAGPKGYFNPEVSGFDPETFELTLEISLTDDQGEGQAHYEHNELITKSAATRRNFLEGGARDDANWVVHELMQRNTTTRDLVEVYEKSISMNSPKIVTFSTLHQGIDEGWGNQLSTATRGEVARQIDEALKMARTEILEWGPLPFDKRRTERTTTLYTQAIVIRAMLRIFADWYGINQADAEPGNWERWRLNLRRLKQVEEFSEGGITASCEFLSRRNPIFYAKPGGGIYTMNKTARAEQTTAAASGRTYLIDPLHDLTVQNVRGSLDFIYTELKSFLGEEPAGRTEDSSRVRRAAGAETLAAG